MTLGAPAFLLLAIPLALAYARWRPATRALRVLRVLLFIILLLALARLAIVLPSRQGTVVVVADRSASMPRDADGREREVVRDLDSSRGSSRLGVVSFGRAANVELTPDNGRFTAFQGENGADASSLRDGLDTALGLIPPDSSGRIVVVSDGHWSGRDPAPAALAAADRGIAIDYKLVERSVAGDTAVESIDAPASVSPGEAFLVSASLRSPIPQDATVVLRRGNEVVAEGKQKLAAGSTHLTFRDRAARGGVQSYTLEVRAAGSDPRPENNSAKFLVAVNGPKPVLVVPGRDQSRFATMLAAGGVQVETKTHPDLTVDELSGYSAVVLENVDANVVGVNGMKTLAEWVQGGGALMITGGESSFAAGGYFHSPLDPILPVSMELRREHRKLDLSIVIAMDRSGSMAMPAGGGKTKMDLANLAAVQVVDLLGPNDEVGVVVIDSISHIIADLDRVDAQKDLRDRILRVESMGGGIFIYEALSTSAKMLIPAKSPTRHIILFADAADSEEEGDYKNLLDKCEKAGITVSVIGLGTPQDQDAELLRDIARRGNGRAYFTEDPEQLPRVFAQDTFVVARRAFVKDPTVVHATPALTSIAGRSFSALPSIGGYNLTYLRDGASPAVISDDEYHAPIVAAWQVGLGRVLAYTAEADGAYTGALGKWNDVGNFDASLVRWIAGASTSLAGDMLVRQHVENGAARIELHLDPERESNPITRVPHVVSLSGRAGSAAKSAQGEMRWATPDLLETEVPLDGTATTLSTVVVDGVGHVALPPVCAPYSPEHAPVDEAAGRAAMERLSRATGGKERIAVADVWRDLPKRRREIPLRGWLIVAAMVVLLVEVLERRLALLSNAGFQPAALAASSRRGRRDTRRPEAAAPAGGTPLPTPPPAPPVEDDELVNALKRAKDRASTTTRN